MEKLNSDLNVRRWTTKHKIRIPYSVDKIAHYYIPDFLIETINGVKILEETKGYIEDELILKLKIKAARKYCRENGLIYKISYDKNS